MNTILIFVIISAVFVLASVITIMIIKLASSERAKKAEREIESYMAGLVQERNEINKGTRESLQILNITEQDEYNGFPALVRAIMRHLDFKRWGFRIIHSGKLFHQSGVILQSEFCKVRILTFRDRPYEEPEIHFSYGRLHAPNEDHLMTWEGEKYHCWHDVRQVLNFLDGLTPQETFKNPRAPIFMSEFYEKNKLKGWPQTEMEVQRQAAMWEHYGQNLFNLFDLRHSDLWKKYSSYYKELYNIRVTYPDHSITPDHKIF